MSELTFLVRSHPFLLTGLVLGFSPVLVTLLVLFSPLLVSLMLFLLGIAGLARSRRRLERNRSRRRKRRLCEHTGHEGNGTDKELETEKQNRVNEYLEDQLKNLELDAVTVPGSVWDHPFQENGAPPDSNSGVRSDVSEIGDVSDWEEE